MKLPSSDFLPRWPRSAWEGFFVIAIPRRGCPVRWLKTHLFRSRARRGFHPIAAVEGLTAKGELWGTAAFGDRLVEGRAAFEPEALRVGATGLALELPGRARLWEEAGQVALWWRDEASQLEASLTLEPREVVQWARLPPALRYLGVHARLKGALKVGKVSHDLSGLGVVEHAFGALVPFDPARFPLGRWHWDVLSFEDDDGALATLTVNAPLLGMRGLRAGGQVPGVMVAPISAAGVEYLEVEHDHPKRWLGRARGSTGELVYEAVASTPLARAAPGGGFLGFNFEATFTAAGARPRHFAGRGFCECGGNRPIQEWARPSWPTFESMTRGA